MLTPGGGGGGAASRRKGKAYLNGGRNTEKYATHPAEVAGGSSAVIDLHVLPEEEGSVAEEADRTSWSSGSSSRLCRWPGIMIKRLGLSDWGVDDP